MKKLIKLAGIIAFTAIIGFSFAACNLDDTLGADQSPPSELKGVSLTAMNGNTDVSSSAKVGNRLVANIDYKKGYYDPKFKYEWMKDGVVVATNTTDSNSWYTPTEAGTYTVKVSGEYEVKGDPVTSNSITVNAN